MAMCALPLRSANAAGCRQRTLACMRATRSDAPEASALNSSRRAALIASVSSPLASAAAGLQAPPAAAFTCPPDSPAPKKGPSLRKPSSAEMDAFVGACDRLFNSRPNGAYSFTPILLRTAFHDAGTWNKCTQRGGANASILFELDRAENEDVVFRFGWPRVDEIKQSLLNTAASSFSLADVIALAPAIGIERLGGGSYREQLLVGRPDATDEDPDNSNHSLPAKGEATQETLDELKDNFAKKGFSTREMVILSGAHTIGRISVVAPSQCDTSPGNSCFSNNYYNQLLSGAASRAALGSDRALLLDETRPILEEFGDADPGANPEGNERKNRKFLDEFRKTYIKLINLGYST